MTVFMGTRQRYQLARFEYHSKFAWMFALMVSCVPLSYVLGNVTLPLTTAVVSSVAMTSKNGRKTTKRLCNESFYGCLFSFTGVFHTTGANRVGR